MSYQTTMVQFGEWMPDDDRNITPGAPGPALNAAPVTLQDAKNVIYTGGAYRPLQPPVQTGAAIPVAPVDAFAAMYGGSNWLIGGSGAALYYSKNGGASWTACGSGFTGAGWQFAQYGNCVYATNGTDPIQVMDLSAGSPSFTALNASAAPKAYAIGVIRDFLVAGNITAGDQVGAFVIQWSGLAQPSVWDIPNTQQARADQSGAQTLYSQYGQVQYIAQGEEQAMIFQQTGITRVQYVGGDVVFGFYTFERKRGLLAPRACAQVSNTVYFLAADGFYSTDGTQVQPIGYGKVNRWFFSDCSNTSLVRCAADTLNNTIVWSYPNNSSGYTQLIYNIVENQWTHGSYSSPLLFQGLNGTQYQPKLFDTSNIVNTFSGSPTDCELTTNNFRFDPSRRSLVVSLRILSDDANTATAGICGRVSDQDTVTYVGYGTPETISRQISVRSDGFMHSINVKLTSSFTYAQGVSATYAVRGRK